MFAIIFSGSGKSTPVNYIKKAMCQLIDLFPDFYNRKINTNNQAVKITFDRTTDFDGNSTSNNAQFDAINKTTSHSIDSNKRKSIEERMKMIVNFDTELALFRQMALVSILYFFQSLYSKTSYIKLINFFQIGDLFAITDELDSQLVRLGVFKSNDDAAASGSKLLTQAYDGVHNESRGTGTAKQVINNGKLAIFGASTGQRYTFNMRNFSQNIDNDGVLVRMSYLVMPHGGPKPMCNRLPISMPNALHIATVISLIVNCGYPVQLRFEKLQSDLDNEPQGEVFLLKNFKISH